jgi:HEAT repeat protein
MLRIAGIIAVLITCSLFAEDANKGDPKIVKPDAGVITIVKPVFSAADLLPKYRAADIKGKAELANALGETGDPQVIPDLISALSAGMPLSGRAASGLGALTRKLRDQPELRTKVIESLVPALREALKTSEKLLIFSSAATLATFGAQAAPAVPEMLAVLRKATDDASRMHYINVLGNIGPAAVDTLPDIMAQSRTKILQCSIAIAIGKIAKGGPEVEKTLCQCMISDDERTRVQSIYAAGKVKFVSNEIRTLLEAARKDASAAVRDAATQVLAAQNVGSVKPPEPPRGDF